MTLIKNTILACLVFGAAGLTGCNGNTPIDRIDCTEIGCSSTVTFVLPDLDLGEYQINVEMEYLSAECAFSIPMEEVTCTSEDGLYLDSNGDLYASMPMVEEGGLAETVSVIIINPFEDSDIPYVDVEADVDWSDPYYPNGEECDEFACFSATVTL